MSTGLRPPACLVVRPGARRPPAGAGAKAAWRRRRLVLVLMSPWIVGLRGVHRLPARDERLPLVHPLRPAQPAALDRPRELPLHVRRRRHQIWPAIYNTLWIIVVGVPLQVLFAFGIAVMLTRAKQGVGFFRTVFYLPALAPPVAATLGFVYLLNPATGPVNTVLEALGIKGPLWFNDPAWAKPSLVLLSALGRSATRW